MGTIKFFLKFGQREYMETFAKGNLYFSNAEKFWGIDYGFNNNKDIGFSITI